MLQVGQVCSLFPVPVSYLMPCEASHEALYDIPVVEFDRLAVLYQDRPLLGEYVLTIKIIL